MSEKIDRKKLIEMIQLLNSDTVILDKIGLDKIKTSKTNTQRLTFKFRDMMHAIDEKKLLDDIPESCWNFYHDNRDHLAIEKEKKEIVKTESEEVDDTIENNIKRKKVEKEKEKEKPVEKKDDTKKDSEVKPKKSKTEKDKYGLVKGTIISNMFYALKKKPMKMDEVKKCSWANGQTQYNNFKKLIEKGLAYKNQDGMMRIK